ncbi:MAG: hypothetical protein JF615_04545 [Asticcacaulis sp.]|nr:hypothetical protein [Asticcacaulis sp.]
MANLWKRWWFRALIGALTAPLVMGAGTFPVLLVMGFLVDGYVNWSAAAMMFPVLSLVEVAAAVLPWIAMEIGNRQRKRPLSPRLTAAWLSLSSAYLAGLVGLMVQFGTWFPATHLGVLMRDIRTGLPIALTVYVLPFVLAWLTVRPFVVRWVNAAGAAERAAIF